MKVIQVRRKADICQLILPHGIKPDDDAGDEE